MGSATMAINTCLAGRQEQWREKDEIKVVDYYSKKAGNFIKLRE
jgi:hypothetical protein